MNCFFASCEIAENPSLKEKKVVVCPSTIDQKGIILAASYEARPYGIHAAMRLSDALRKCPDLIIIEPTNGLYGEYSRKFFEYFLKITPLVEPASIDEGFLDVTDVCSGVDALELAKKIQEDLLSLFKLPCSIGIAPNKFLAKMASDMKKPLGITVLRRREVPEKLWPLPIKEMIGVGKKSLETMSAIGIKTIGDLANYPDLQLLKDVIGETNATNLYAHANGIGSNEVDVNRFTDVSSISNSQTFDHDEYDVSNMKLVMKLLTNTMCNRMEKHNLKAFNFCLQLKYNNYKVTSKSVSLRNPTSDSRRIYKVFESIFDDFYDSAYPLRLIGVAANKVIESVDEIKQMSIFDSLDTEQKDAEIDNLIKNLNSEFGASSLTRGIKEKVDINNKNIRTDKYDKSWKDN